MPVHDSASSPAPQGSPLATLEIKTPTGNVGRTVIASLRSNGRIVAQGRAQVSKFDDARIILVTSEYATHRGSGDYELWVTLDRDGLESWYPGFSDWFIREPWHFHEGPWKQFSDLGLWKERQLSDPKNLLRVHYHRYGGYYEGIGLWTWNPNTDTAPVEIFEVGQDEFGLIFDLDKSDYGEVSDYLKIGLLPRRGGDWALKEDDNKFWDQGYGDEIYLIGTVNYLWKERPDTRQQVLAAHIDSPHGIAIEVSRPVDPGEINADKIYIVDDHHQRVAVRHINLGDRPSSILTVYTEEALDVGGRSYSISLEHFSGNVLAGLRDILHDASLFYDPVATLGAYYSPSATTFRLFAPTANKVEALLYDSLTDNAQPLHIVGMRKIGKGVFEGTQTGDMLGKFYHYRLHGSGFSNNNKILDPYAINTVGDSSYARITHLSDTNPPEWKRHRIGPVLESPVDMVVYEANVRDFTISHNSGVAHKGGYLGLTETGTRLPENSEILTGLDHLQELGITHVQLMPVQDFQKDEDDGVYNWGYMTVAFNSPEGWFATNRLNDSRIRELKCLITALHARNIGVIMDVVYNHTDYSSPFHIINAQYYYRFYPGGHYANGSGVGNDFRTESPMVRKFIVDSLKYWVEEYGVDGFRFDLMALIDADTMREVEAELRKLKPGIVIYGEPWSSGHSPMRGQATDKHALRHLPIGAFNDHFRNALGGSPSGSEWGFIQNGSQRERLALGLEGSCRDWAVQPAQSVNYMTCHDNLVLYDKLRWFNPAASESDIQAMMKLGYLLLFTAQGIPFLHSGEEFARTKYGHGNSYNAGDEINRVDWSLKAKNFGLFAYTRDLIRLRKEHPLFRLRTAESAAQRVKTHLPPETKTLMYAINGEGLDGEAWAEARVLANGEDSADVEFLLPPGRWSIALDENGSVQDEVVVEQRVTVKRKSGLILFRIEEPPPPAVAISAAEPAEPLAEASTAEPDQELDVAVLETNALEIPAESE